MANASSLLYGHSLFMPAAQEATDLGDHAGGVLVLAWLQPLPAGRETQVEPDLVQSSIGLAEPGQTRLSPAVVGLNDEFLEVQGGIQKPFGDSKALATRKVVQHWH